MLKNDGIKNLYEVLYSQMSGDISSESEIQKRYAERKSKTKFIIHSGWKLW